MRWYPSRISTRLTIGGILLLAVTTAIIIIVMLWRGQPRVVEINTALIEETGHGLTSRVSTILSHTGGNTVSLARMAEVLPNDEALYRYIPPNLIESNSLITGGGIWPEPGAFTPGIEKRSFFWARNPAGELVFSDEYNKDSTDNYHNESWYQNAQDESTERCLWSDVYSDTVSGVNMVTCSVPYKTGGKFSGVVTTDIRLDNIAAIMQQYGNSTGGYAFVTDRHGQLIYFPGDDSKKFKTFDELAAQSGWLAPVAAGLKLQDSEQSAPGSIRIDHDGQLNTSSQVMLFPMADTGWVIGLATPESRVTGLANIMMQDVLEVLLPVMTLLLLGSWLAVRRLITRLNETYNALDDIARGEGDLTKRMAIAGNDEISDISRAFNLFADKISSMLLTVRSSSAVVAENTVSLADNNNELSVRVTQQAAALEQSAAAMEELNVTVRQNSDNTHMADKLAETTAQTASRCGDMMHNVISTMSNVSTSSGRMFDIVSVIDSIAFQTNILALNAAVEAARAGNSGRGFAVVATEVRSLAQRSARAAREIKVLIDESVQNIKTGSSQVHESGETLNQLVEDVLKVRQLMSDLRVAGEEQSKGLAEVTMAVTEMDTTVQQNATLIDNAVSRTQLLKSEAEQLAQMVSVFKLPETH
ncbi:TPA: methyl-accepting chemotaxis protein [Morganella morganii]